MPVRYTNLALKFAIFASGRHQQDIARLARLEPQKLSHAIYGRRELMPREQIRLAKVLCRPVEELFPAGLVPPMPTAATPPEASR